jgi:carnosine N-methyltransferase
MCIGDFVDLYGTTEETRAWDAVVTCFFLDTAPVVVEYVETIEHALRPGGIWTNLGPLLYHWTEDVDHNEDERYERSIEVCPINEYVNKNVNTQI